MVILNEIPFSLDAASVMKQLHLEPESDDAKDFLRLMDVARKVGKPKAVYTEVFVEGRFDDTVKVGGVSFTSRTLSRNLASSERIFPLIATCGHEMDEAFPARGDMLQEFWWDVIKTHLLGAANRWID